MSLIQILSLSLKIIVYLIHKISLSHILSFTLSHSSSPFLSVMHTFFFLRQILCQTHSGSPSLCVCLLYIKHIQPLFFSLTHFLCLTLSYSLSPFLSVIHTFALSDTKFITTFLSYIILYIHYIQMHCFHLQLMDTELNPTSKIINYF